MYGRRFTSGGGGGSDRGRRHDSKESRGGGGSGGTGRGVGRGSYHASSHASHFLNAVIDGHSKITNISTSFQFLQEAAKYPDTLELVGKLCNPAKSGKAALLRAINISCADENAMNNGVIKFLEVLGSDVCNVGAAKISTEDLYVSIFQLPGFVDVLQEHIEKSRITDMDVVAWFLVTVSKKMPNARDWPAVHKIAAKLANDKCESTAALSTVLYPAQKTIEAEAEQQIRAKSINPAGIESYESLEHLRADKPMHDNDFPLDYRKIAIVPTADELNAPVSASCIETALVINDHSRTSRTSTMLDRQFRLLREDMIAPMKEEKDKELSLPRGSRRRMFSNPRAVGIELMPRPCILIQVDAPPALAKRLWGKKNDNFLENGGKRILGKDACVLFLNDDGEVKHVGEIVRRDEKEMSRRPKILVVGINLLSGSLLDILQLLRQFELQKKLEVNDKVNDKKKYTHTPPIITPLLFQASSSLFAYKPVLERLKDMVTIPFADQLAHKLPPAVNPTPTSLSRDMEKTLSSDPSQLKAVQQALNSNVSLIHGPPGCGKSFVGVSITKEILTNQHFAYLNASTGPEDPLGHLDLGLMCLGKEQETNPSMLKSSETRMQELREKLSKSRVRSEKILCICYTNHALDDFLESLVSSDVPLNSIVRLGNSPKISENMKSRCITNIDETAFNRLQSLMYGTLKAQLKESEDEIHEMRRDVEYFEWGRNSWKDVEAFLARFPKGSLEHKALLELRMQQDEFNLPGMQRVGKGGKKAQPNEVWMKWINGNAHPQAEKRQVQKQQAAVGGSSQVDEIEFGLNLFRSTSAAAGSPAKDQPKIHQQLASLPEDSIWRKSPEQRREMLQKWHTQSRKERLSCLAELFVHHNTLLEKLAALRSELKVKPLMDARIIGCTTTSAAKFASILSSVGITTMIVEEAAEILEAHILTSLCPSVKRLVMIGDHLQLRAKLEHYPLRKESGKQINFDESLFERLVFQGNFPVSMLNVQHRMRPEISAFVRQTTYPELKDHESTLTRKHIRGLASDVVFINHTHPESTDADAELTGSSSKTNMHEADMALAIAQYLLCQGYEPSEMVILTPYLGQLVTVRDKLAHADIGSEISDRDKGELSKIEDLKLLAEKAEADNSQVNKRQAAVRGSSLPEAGAPVKDEPSSSSSSSGAPKRSSIRVSTIDNFQGEEAKIVIASLVRSNEQCDIGFLSGSERVNVLFSRARDGFIVIGNANCFENARTEKGRVLWCGILDKLRAAGAVKKGLSTVCQEHEAPNELATPDAFAKLCRDGGCDKPCAIPLPSCPEGHLCPLRCHPRTKRGVDSHVSMSCRVELPAKCSHGHNVVRICSRTDPEPCMGMVRDDCPQGHFLERHCSKKKPPCAVCWQIEDERQKLEEKLFEEAKRRTEELALAQLQQEKDEQQRQARIEKRQHEASLARMKKERRLMKIESQRLDEELKLLSFQASQHSVADPSSGPDCDSDSGNEGAEEYSVDDSSVDSKPSLPLQAVAADGGQAVDKMMAVDHGQDYGNRDGLLTRSTPGSQQRGPCALGATFARPATLTTSFSASASRGLDKKANSKLEDPAATQPCISSGDLLKFLKPFFVAVEKEDWTRVYELAVAKTQAKPQQVGTSVAVAVLLRLAQLYLGEQVEKLQEELSDIRKKSSNLLSKISVNTDAVAGVSVAAIIQYVSMVVNAADGKLPATTREFARSYLSYDIVQKNLLPASWTVEAESHKDTETNVEPVKKHWHTLKGSR